MKDVNDQKLEDCLRRELRGLPDLKAPATLAPRVMAVIAARQHAPWWRKTWADWPQGMRLAFLAMGLVVAGGLVLVGWQWPQVAGLATLTGGVRETVSGWFNGLAPYLSFAETLLGAVALVIKAAPPAAGWGLLAIVGLAYATCIGLGTLGYRVVLNRI